MRRHFTRRALLLGTSIAPLASKADDQIDAARVLQVNDLDRRIWREELEAFVPQRLYDMHTHLTRSEFMLDPQAKYQAHGLSLPVAAFEEKGSLKLLDAAESLLSPGRTVTHLLMPYPHQKCDFDGSNNFIAREARTKPGTKALMLVHPAMTAERVDQDIVRHRFVGLKPYHWYAPGGNTWNARIPDFMPEHQLAVANRYGLIIGLHVSKKEAIADRENLDDLERLAEEYPRVRWLLYHCARSYSAWAIEKAASRLRRIPNLWYETSSVCETDAFDALFSSVDTSRICYGSDDFPAGVTRGKYITWGYAWVTMDELNQSFSRDHCDGRMTFVRYEMLRGMHRAARRHRLSRRQVEDIFYHNAVRLVSLASRSVTAALGPENPA